MKICKHTHVYKLFHVNLRTSIRVKVWKRTYKTFLLSLRKFVNKVCLLENKV